jgi:6-phosphogluconolactonase (cycloisomerase 2 family)
MKKKKIIFALCLALLSSSVAFASGENPNDNKLGDIVRLEDKNPLQKDEQATVYISEGKIYRVDTRSGKIMQIDHVMIDAAPFGIVIGGAAYQVPDGGELVFQTHYNGNSYFVYKVDEKSIVRVNSRNGVVQSISHIINNI